MRPTTAAWTTATLFLTSIAIAIAQDVQKPAAKPAAKPTLQQQLIHSVIQDEIENVRTFLSKGGDPNERAAPAAEDAWAFEGTSVQDPAPPLILIASRYGSIKGPQIIQMLIDKGANVNLADKNGVTPLMVAAELGMGGFYLLAEKGAKVNVADKEGRTPLMYAMGNRGYGAAAELLKRGAKINAQDRAGQSALIYAIQGAQDDPFRLYGEDQKKKAKESKVRYAELIQFLVDKGADVNAKDKEGDTPLKIAQRMNRAEIVAILKKAGAKE